MTTFVHVLDLDAEDTLVLMNMADFYSMSVEELLSNAMSAGLHHAESVMVENLHHHKRIAAALLTLAPPAEEETLH